MRNGIDIIIPIYNAYEDLEKCLESVERHTDLALDRLILVNDKSSDGRILPLLRSKESENVVVIDNEENMGFSNNVNKGMNCSKDRDVILLNSDTVVTAGWVDKIYECAHSRPEIGTVTPLSNAATLCSVPLFCQDNKLPDGLSADDMAQIVERCSIKAYPRITVAVGFCMFIKREVIKAAGLFDAKTFEKGYGEENDFCNRAEQLGFIHVMCDNAFVYHRGTASFRSESKAALCAAHEKILNGWYPAQMLTNHLYCMSNPDQWIRENVKVFIDLKNGRKNVLYLVHRDFRKEAFDSVGGTQFHVRDLTENLKNRFNVFVMARDRDYLCLTVYAGEKRHFYRFYIGNPPLFFQFRNGRLYEIFRAVLDRFQIDLVHIHHAESLSLDLYYAAREKNVKIVQTLHDYFSISISPQTVLDDDLSEAKRLFRSNMGYRDAVDILPVWHKNWLEVFSFCEKIIAPSESVMENASRFFPEIRDRIEVIYHGSSLPGAGEILEVEASEILESENLVLNVDRRDFFENSLLSVGGWALISGVPSDETEIFIGKKAAVGKFLLKKCARNSRFDVAIIMNSDSYLSSGFSAVLSLGDGESEIEIFVRHGGKFYKSAKGEIFLNRTEENRPRRKIALIGGISQVKGSDRILEIMEKHLGDEYEWYLIGAVGDARISALRNENLHKVGFYAPEDLKEICSSLKPDLALFLSTWPETFCYTLSEAILNGIPVLGTELGAIGERIRKNEYGWTVPHTATGREIVEKIDSIFVNLSEYESVLDRARTFKEKSVSEMCGEYGALYEKILESSVGNRGISCDPNLSETILSALVVDGKSVWRKERFSFLTFYTQLQLKNFVDEGGRPTEIQFQETVPVFESEEAKRKLEGLQKETGEKSREIENLRTELEKAKSELNSMKNSRSYRITKPLRKVMRIIRGGEVYLNDNFISRPGFGRLAA